MNKELLQQPLEVRLAALMCHYDNEDRPSLKDALRTELAATSAKQEGDAKDAPYDPQMMYAEKDKGVLEMRISGLSMREIKDIFELEYGAVVWSDGVAYPADKVVLKFTRADFSDISAIASQKGEA